MQPYIICSREQCAQNNRKRRRRIKAFVICLLVLLLLVVAISCWRNMLKSALKIAEDTVRQRMTLVINTTVCEALQGFTQNTLISFQRDADGEIVAVLASAAQANRLALKTSADTQTALQVAAKSTVSVPVGTVSGLPLLSGKGPSLQIAVAPTVQVQCSFTSEFIQAGINQTLHRIYLNVQTELQLVLPTFRSELVSTTPVLVCESVIVGRVPEAYLGGLSIN